MSDTYVTAKDRDLPNKQITTKDTRAKISQGLRGNKFWIKQQNI